MNAEHVEETREIEQHETQESDALVVKTDIKAGISAEDDWESPVV